MLMDYFRVVTSVIVTIVLIAYVKIMGPLGVMGIYYNENNIYLVLKETEFSIYSPSENKLIILSDDVSLRENLCLVTDSMGEVFEYRYIDGRLIYNVDGTEVSDLKIYNPITGYIILSAERMELK